MPEDKDITVSLALGPPPDAGRFRLGVRDGHPRFPMTAFGEPPPEECPPVLAARTFQQGK